jgi:hypothetical protein
MINIPDMSQQIEDANKPALPVGYFLAVVTGVEEKYNPEKGSIGQNWSLLINSNPDSINEGWDTEAKVVALDYYTYMGTKKSATAKVEVASNPFNLIGMLGALNLKGSFDPSDVRHRQVIVNIKHEASMDDQAMLKADPTHVVERYFPKVKFAKAYRVGEEIGPKLAHLADDAENTDPKPEAEEEF